MCSLPSVCLLQHLELMAGIFPCRSTEPRFRIPYFPGRNPDQFGSHLSGTARNDRRDAFPVSQDEKPVPCADGGRACAFCSYVSISQRNFRNLQSACISDTLSISCAELRIVSFISVWTGGLGCVCSEDCSVCGTGADPASAGRERLPEASGGIRG